VYQDYAASQADSEAADKKECSCSIASVKEALSCAKNI
jgi:hypothetical protein